MAKLQGTAANQEFGARASGWLRLTWVLIAGWLAVAVADAQSPAPPTVTGEALPKVIRVAPDPDFAPIDYFERGRHQGIAADLLALLARREGVRFDVVRVSSWQAAVDALAAGRADLLSSAVISPARLGSMRFTRPYIQLQAGALVRKGSPPITPEDLKRLSVALVAADDIETRLADRIDRSRLTRCPRLQECLEALAAGQTQVVLSELLTARHALRKLGIANLEIAFELDIDYRVAFATAADKEALADALDRALGALSAEEQQAILARWLDGEKRESSMKPRIPVEPGRAAELEARLAASAAAPEGERSDLEQALAGERRIAELAAQLDTLLAESEQIEQRIAEAARLLEANPRDELLAWRAGIPQQLGLRGLENRLAQERARLDSARAALASSEQALAEAEQARSELLSALEEVSRREIPAEIAEPPSARSARQVWIDVATRLRQAERMLLEQRLALLPSRLHLLALERRLARRQLKAIEGRVAWLEQRIAEVTGEEIASLRAEIAAQLASIPKDLEAYARANLEAVEQLAQTVADAREWQTLASTFRNRHEETQRALQDTRERLALGAQGSAIIGGLLRRERQRLPDPRELDRQLQRTLERAAEARVLQISLRDAQHEEDSGRSSVNLAELDIDQRAEAQRLLNTWAELSVRLEAANRQLLEQLKLAEDALIDLKDTTRVFSQLLERELLWTRSHLPLSTLLAAGRGPLPLPLPGSTHSGLDRSALLTLLGARPLTAALIVSTSLLLWALRGHLWQRVLATSAATRNIREDRFGYTLQALLASLLRVLPGPLLCWLGGWLLRAEAEALPQLAALGHSLIWGGMLWLLGLGLQELGREEGIGHRHFRFPRARRELLRRGPALLVLPMMILLSIGATAPLWGPETAIDAIPRIAMIGFEILLALTLWRLFAPGFFRPRGASADAPVGRAARLTRLLALLIPLALALALAAGYVYTAVTLTQMLLLSTGALFLVWLGYHLAARALVLGARRLAAARAAGGGSPAASRDDGQRLDAAAAHEITLDDVNQQVRVLLRVTATLLATVWLLAIWKDTAPALAALDDIHLWSVARNVEGKEVLASVSLLDLLGALLAVVLMVVGSRNLPGLLELLLRPLALAPATQYAVTSLCRYTVILVGVVVALGLLGLEWSKLQWLVAALGVGIGFGLQEIIANFVSGLILLFERPVRVGDTVTLGEFSGTVARIDIRATTLIDWDNREVVVPNKAFLTEKVVNWTLSDTVTRITIRVGVSYDSPPALVQQTLLEVAREQPEVLATPEPIAVLTGFGASTLDFELRCHVARMNERVRTTDRLHQAIIRAFRERGIAIDYPQLDVHIRRKA
jgi:potassium efflux system protein